MGQGQGSITVQQKRENPVIPPPAVAGARNGLSIDALLNAVLGNDENDLAAPAALISNREIPMDGFDFWMKDAAAGNRLFAVEPSNDFYALGDIDGLVGRTFFFADNANGQISMTTGTVNSFGLNNANQSASATLNSNRYLALEHILNLYGLGDLDDAASGLKFVIDEAGNSAYMGAAPFQNPAPGNETHLRVDDVNQIIEARDAAGQSLYLDMLQQIYVLGDINGVSNGTFLEIQAGLNNIATIGGNPGQTLRLDQSGGSYQMGDINAAANGMILDIDDTNERANIRHGADDLLRLDFANGDYRIGAISGLGNGTEMRIDDSTGEIGFLNTASAAFLSINSTPGFTGTVTPVTTITVDGGIVTNVA